jgi:hypothetical protein
MKAWIWFFITLIGVAISLAGLEFGAWWLTFGAGIVIGVFIGQGRVAVPAGALAGLVSWGLGLAILQVYFGLGPAARSLAAIMGFTGQPAIPLVLTCLVGLLLGLTGAWLASALRGLLVPATR